MTVYNQCHLQSKGRVVLYVLYADYFDVLNKVHCTEKTKTTRLQNSPYGICSKEDSF